MKKNLALVGILTLMASSFPGNLLLASAKPLNPSAASDTETIVLVRHGEKTVQEYGQLSSKGLNRSLALPEVLIGKYGKPDFLFAPNPAALIHSRTDSKDYCYVRPLATIEPTAIKLGMPVNTQFGFTDIKHLEAELAQPMYANSVVFVAWEHGYLDKFAKEVVKTYGGDDDTVPKWPGSDYDTIFVIRLSRSGDKTTESFTVDHEGLNDKLADDYPHMPAAK